MTEEFAEVGLALLMLLIGALFHYHFRRVRFCKEPFIYGPVRTPEGMRVERTYRQPRHVVIFEHLSFGLLLTPMVEAGFHILKLSHGPTRDEFLHLGWLATFVVLGFFAYFVTVAAELTLDEIEYNVSLHLKSLGPAVRAHKAKVRTVYVTLSLMYALVCFGLLLIYSPTLSGNIGEAIRQLNNRGF